MKGKTQKQEQKNDIQPMKIDVRIHSVRPGSNLVAFASVTIGGQFAVKGIKIFDGENGLFVSMPSVKDSKGEYQDICFPVTKEFREHLNNAVLTAYGEVMEKTQNNAIEDEQSSGISMA